MNDPYQVLGVSHNASMDEIKKAYRTLIRKYHPDANINNPNADLTAEKFREVQQAYDTIVKQREARTSYNSQYNYSDANSSSYTGTNDYSMVYIYLRDRRYMEALHLLSGMTRDAHWYYLSAFANAGCGNNWQALNFARQAVSMDPYNAEYRNLLNQLQSCQQRYNATGRSYGRRPVTGSECCDAYCTLCLADSCCECMGGDLCLCM